MIRISGKEVAAKVRQEVQQACARFIESTGNRPCLAVILVGDDPASATYVASKGKACDQMGFLHRDYHLEATISENELIKLITALNEDIAVDGILVQLPLPSHINEHKVLHTVSADKDVDGLHPTNMGKLILGTPVFIPCTPGGILRLLDEYEIDTVGKQVVVVGRSNIVGKPIAALLMQKGRDATVTMCHSRTADLAFHTRSADILIVAIGSPLAITASMVKEGAVVIDVGINRINDASRKRGYRLVGDVDFDQVAPKSYAITPVPGGVGPMTIAILMKNTLHAAVLHHGRSS